MAADGREVGRILAVLGAAVGVPYLALASTSTVMHAWLGRLRPEEPYRLYAWSNAASIGALAAWPLLVEPWFRAPTQVLVWSALFVALALLTGVCAFRTARAPVATPIEDEAGHERFGRVASWVLLPALASVLLLVTTEAMSRDVSVVSLLWVLPLALYLLTFVLAFRHERPRDPARGLLYLAVGAAMLAVAMNTDLRVGMGVQIALYCGGMFLSSLALHHEVHRVRPHRRDLGAYYLAMALGGALGGAGVSLVAPLVFDGHHELPLSVLLCLLPMFALQKRVEGGGWRPRVAWGLAGVVFAGQAGWLLREGVGAEWQVIEQVRSFHGVFSVKRIRPGRPDEALVLVSGRVTHGMQLTDPARRLEPQMYYRAGTAIAEVLGPDGPPRRVGLIGLGTGSLAAYGRAGDTYVFYEYAPEVARLAREHFTFLSESKAAVAVVPGDARRSLERARVAEKDDVFVIDAFNGDAVPAHLLTVEAFELYLGRLAPDGVVAVHVSNSHLDLARLVQRVAAAVGLRAEIRQAGSRETQDLTTWVLLRRGDPGPPPARTPLWVDGYTPLVPLLR